MAALALVEATGAVDADITLEAAEVGQGVTFDASARGLRIGGTAIGSLDADARISDALGLPMVDGSLTGADLVLGGVGIAALSAEAEQLDRDRMRFSADGRLAIGTLADASGELARVDGGFAATLSTLSLRQPGIAATLAAPATVTVQDGAIDLTPLELSFGTGSLTAKGRDRRELRRRRGDPLDAAGAGQHHPPRPRPRRHRRRHGADHRAAGRAGRALRPAASPASPRGSPAAPGCRRSRCRRAAPPRTAG